MAAATEYLEISGLSKDYEGCRALDDLCLCLGRGEFLTLFGPNGAGKSTLLRIIATLTSPTSGRVRVRGFDLEEDAAKFRMQLGFISHHSLLYDQMTAMENLVFYGSLYAIADPEARALELLRQVDLHHRRHQRVGGFSRGMRQRLSIARALVNDPAILLLDEPFTGLDQEASALLAERLLLLRQWQRTVIMVTHDMDRGLAMADRIGILVSGRLVFLARRDHIDPAAFAGLYRAALAGEVMS